LSEPATKEQLEQAKQSVLDRLDALEKRTAIGMEGFRQQQSAEHGAHQASLISLREGIYWIVDWCKRMFNHDKR
jgi:hypothetical protein